jgi:hypothetical protein
MLRHATPKIEIHEGPENGLLGWRIFQVFQIFGWRWHLVGKTATQLQVRSIENAEKNPKEIDNWACSSGISMGHRLPVKQ